MGFSIQVFAVFRGSCLATSNEKPECEKNFLIFNASVNGSILVCYQSRFVFWNCEKCSHNFINSLSSSVYFWNFKVINQLRALAIKKINMSTVCICRFLMLFYTQAHPFLLQYKVHFCKVMVKGRVISRNMELGHQNYGSLCLAWMKMHIWNTTSCNPGLK